MIFKGNHKLKLLLIGLILSICSIFQMGYSNAYVNTAIDKFKVFLNESYHSDNKVMENNTYYWLWSLILNVWFLGFCIGTWISIPISDYFGRKPGLLFANMITIVSVSIMGVSILKKSILLLIFGRVLSAIGAGIAMSSLILFLQEIAPLNLRGTLSFYSELSFVSTNAIGAFMGMPRILGDNLFALIMIATIPSVIIILILFFLYETPLFLYSAKKDEKKALKSLSYYHGTNDKILQLRFLMNNTSEKGQKLSINLFKDLFTIPYYRKGLVLGLLALQVTCSIWPIIYYSTEFLIKTNVNEDMAKIFSTTMLIVSVLATFLGQHVVERMPRRPLFITVSIINTLALFSFWFFDQLRFYTSIDFFKYGCVAAIFLHGITYSFATGPIAWFIEAELIPISHRLLAQTLCLSTNHIVALIITFVTLPLYNIIGSYTIIILYVLPATCSLIWLFKYLPETKDKTSLEVIELLKMK
uniref:MFS domain-containing protein n=1 Tax=Parastrongyloides trichosuri TaxID=131310 RepID=A0A0N4ZC37_PARTI